MKPPVLILSSSVKYYLFFLCNLTLSVAVAQNEQSKKTTDSLLNIAYNYYLKNKDSLEFYIEKAQSLTIENKDIDNIYETHIVDAWNSSYFGDLERMERSINALDSITLMNQKKFDALSTKYDRIIQLGYTKGMFYEELKDYENSKHYFNDIISLSSKLNDSQLSKDNFYLIIESNNYLASMYVKEDKFDVAEQFYNENLRLVNLKSLPQSESYNTFMLLANMYGKQGKFNKANNFILKYLDYYKNKFGTGNNRVIVAYQRLTENYLSLNNIEKAKYYLALMRKEFTPNHSMLNRYYQIKSKVSIAEGLYKDAITTLTKNIKFLEKKWSNSTNIEVVEVYRELGSVHKKFKRYQESLIILNKALDLYSNSSLNSIISELTKFEILAEKLEVLYKLDRFDEALKTADSAISILNELRTTFKSTVDKRLLKENIYTFFETAIAATFNLYKKNQNVSYIKKAFFYFEKSKAMLLLETVMTNKAEKFVEIPDSILKKVKQTNARINYFEKAIKKESTLKKEAELFKIRNQQRNLITAIEKEYPNYYNLKYNTKVISIKTMQSAIDHKTAYATYFYGESNIYLIEIFKNKLTFKRIPINKNITSDLNTYTKFLKNTKSNLDDLHLLSNKLFNILTTPSIRDEKIENLVILPDGILNFLPFESLRTNIGNYWIEEKSISYSLSTTLLHQLTDKRINESNTVIAFAPNFNNDAHVSKYKPHLLPLVHNQKEAQQILNHFEGKLFIRDAASLANFKSNLDGVTIIHLATHAVLDDKNPNFSYLAFSGKTKNTNDLLYANDIFNAQVNAEMVVLSACETGIGKINKGEGARSLAQSFFYSGAKSIASTLWKVDDASSSQIMDVFYKNLAGGSSKSIALQNAKLTFIDTNKDNAKVHPYYWSAFIISGNPNAVIQPNNTLIFTTIFAFLMLIVSIYILFQIRNKK